MPFGESGLLKILTILKTPRIVSTLVRRANQQENPPRFLLKRRRPDRGHQRVSRRLERETQTVCLDGDRRIHRDQTRALPPNSRADPARLYGPKDPQTKDQLIRGHYTSGSNLGGVQVHHIFEEVTGLAAEPLA